MMRLLRMSAALVALAGMASVGLAAGYDSFGFEQPLFVPGPLVGQNGWTGSATGGGIPPTVVTAPDPVLGEQAIRLEVGPTQGDSSTMDHAFIPADLIAAGYTQLTVSYDVYRVQDATDQNLWWWLWDSGEPTYGLQWDGNGTLPHGWNPGAGSATTVFGAYANVTMTWDLTTLLAYSWYNGAVVDNGIPITNVNSLSGWTIVLGHDAADSAVGDVAWIDNFQAVAIPEPASLALLALAVLLRRR